MIGTTNGSNAASNGAARSRPLADFAPVPVSGAGRTHAAGQQTQDVASTLLTPFVLLVLVGLWLLWFVVERHQRIRNQVQPKNIAMNLRNLWAVFLPVVIAYALVRVALVKLNVWFGAVPYVGPVIKALIKIVA